MRLAKNVALENSWNHRRSDAFAVAAIASLRAVLGSTRPVVLTTSLSLLQ